MSNQTKELFQLRLYFKADGAQTGKALAFVWRDADKALAALKTVDEAAEAWAYIVPEWGAPKHAADLPCPIVSIVDDFGNVGRVDVRRLETWGCNSTINSARMHNELQAASLRGQMHYNKLVEADPELKAFIEKMRRDAIAQQIAQSRGLVIPGGHGNA